jgi:hypothetical protein
MAENLDEARTRGRPKGSGPVAQLRRQLIDGGRLEKLVARVYSAAMNGDMAAMRILLDRVLPPLRAVHLPVALALPDGSLTDQAKAILKAATDGTLPPDVAAELIGALAKVAGVDQVDELRRQVEALEAAAMKDFA